VDTVESHLYSEIKDGDKKLQMQLLDRHGLMQVRYLGMADLSFNYLVDRSDFHINLKQNLGTRTQVEIEHRPAQRQSSVNMSYSW
jgi:hypothetical protein